MKVLLRKCPRCKNLIKLMVDDDGEIVSLEGAALCKMFRSGNWIPPNAYLGTIRKKSKKIVRCSHIRTLPQMVGTASEWVWIGECRTRLHVRAFTEAAT